MKETSKIYLDIESLLDIRQAILSKLMNIKDLVEYINSDEYNFRKTDIFPIDMSSYKSINDKHEIDLLERSTVTFILNAVRSKLENLEKRNSFYGETKIPEVLLNIYPFNLNEKQIDILQNLLFVKLDSKCIITVINKPISELTPYFIKSLDIIVCYIYNFTEWLNKHTDALSVTKIPDTMFYFPSIYKLEDTNNELEKINKLGFKDIFSYIEFLYSSIANITFLPIIFYTNIVTATSIIDKYNIELKNTKLGDQDGDSKSEV